eukprot:2266089-Alexandrium_andersonii.AAC.1
MAAVFWATGRPLLRRCIVLDTTLRSGSGAPARRELTGTDGVRRPSRCPSHRLGDHFVFPGSLYL